MAKYRVHLFDRLGRERAAATIECQDDAEAISVVEEHSLGNLMELREGARLVKRFEARAPPRASADG